MLEVIRIAEAMQDQIPIAEQKVILHLKDVVNFRKVFIYS
jgi:hypothetical protein